MAITQYSSVSTYVNTIYERSMFALREENVMLPLVTNFSAQGFMTRTVPLWATVTAAAATDAVDYNNPTTMSKSQLATYSPGEVIAQALLTDQMMETDPDGAVSSVSRELGSAMATKIDVDLTDVFASFDIDLGPGAGSSADLQSFADCMATIRKNLGRPPIYIVLHPYHWHDIWAELGQPAATYAYLASDANQALRDYFVGDWLGASWFMSANIDIDASDDAISGVFTREALAFDSRRPPRLEVERDASLRASELNLTAGYATGVLRSALGCYYTADATAPS